MISKIGAGQGGEVGGDGSVIALRVRLLGPAVVSRVGKTNTLHQLVCFMRTVAAKMTKKGKLAAFIDCLTLNHNPNLKRVVI